MQLDFDRCYRAVDSRDARFDGWFFTAVRSTGIYCRPSCPAVTPKAQNVTFYPSAAAAQRNGFRACRRCRPDASPGSPEWDNRADVVARAMRLISDGVVDRGGVPELAARLGYTTRHLSRLLVAELGGGPLALARAQRAQTARTLIETTELGLAEIAFAAGFGSVRQFNDTIREVYGVAPSDLRLNARRAVDGPPGTITVRLAYRPPLHAAALLDFLGARTIPGVETKDGDTYRRAMRLPHGTAEAALTPMDGYVSATLRLTDLRDLAPAVARCRRVLDLDADPVAVDGTLAADPALAPSVATEPGVRVPRAVDGFEMAVRAIIGQQISVSGARTVLGRIVAAALPAGPDPRTTHGDPAGPRTTHDDAAGPYPRGQRDQDARPDPRGQRDPDARPDPDAQPDPDADGSTVGPALVPFPLPADILALPDAALPMPAARRRTVRALAEAVAAGDIILDGAADRTEVERRLLALPGIGRWTAGYIAMRALGDPDVLLASDLGVRRGAAALGLPDDDAQLTEHARRWQPWRSYALIRLWRHA